ncbi:putative mRNA 3-end processing factor [Chitinophaga skermanii]|uniref:Putative mRNA 3-end processing factor n=1 Tax=Chitinophaga skermanii TaxID=331697 RepID=A0A327QR24_9BACT|nr:ligase-associated DNA damage response exonuclease [Chitinophaga skermanii]RAJ06478.1 putative mRNA 3-end processing factor [Chitinophaga skermanii]
MLITVSENGWYCAQADVYIDPWKPVPRALITHGHSDHARPGHQYYLCHVDTKPVLKARLGPEIVCETVQYNESKYINGVQFSFHPAGHVLGSAQIRIEYKGEIWVITGDYKLLPDGFTPLFEPVKCHHFITESTFALPIYKFKAPTLIFDELVQWWQHNQSQNLNTVVLCYSLGKAQAILHHLRDHPNNIYLHGAVANLNDAFSENGYHFVGERISSDTNKESMKGALILAPPSAFGTPWMRKFGDYEVAMCSGWMQLRGQRRRLGVEKGFVYSDHCDFSSLNEAVQLSQAENVYVTHGYETQYVQWLREQYHLNAQVMKTQHDNAEQEDE